MNEKTASFESRLFKYMVVPGIILELSLIILFCTPTGQSLNVLSHSVSGVKAISFQCIFVPVVLLMFSYLVLALVYSIVLPCRFFWRPASFLNSARRFFVYSVIVLMIADLLVIFSVIELLRWDDLDLLNLPVVVPFAVLGLVMAMLFSYWTIKIYKHQNLKLLSLKTLEGVGLFLLPVLVFVLIFFFPPI